MASTLQTEMSGLLAAYLAPSFQEGREIGLAARLYDHEEAHFLYLPAADCMWLAGYDSVSLGLYLAKHGFLGAVHKVEILSQTAMVLLFREECFVAAQPVESDAQLIAFLQEHRFPIPPCE